MKMAAAILSSICGGRCVMDADTSGGTEQRLIDRM